MGKLILIVDDSTVLRASVRFTLAEAGYDVEEAVNGSDGLRRLDELCQAGTRPDLVLTDVNMPVMDGLTFIREAKRTPARFIPILVLTTENEEARIQEGRAAGAAGWLVKPFVAQELLGVVRRFVK